MEGRVSKNGSEKAQSVRKSIEMIRNSQEVLRQSHDRTRGANNKSPSGSQLNESIEEAPNEDDQGTSQKLVKTIE